MRDHRRYGESEMVWYFTGAYIINRILYASCGYDIMISSRVQFDISRMSAAYPEARM